MWWNYRVGEAFWAQREELSLERSRWSQEDNKKRKSRNMTYYGSDWQKKKTTTQLSVALQHQRFFFFLLMTSHILWNINNLPHVVQ